MKKLICILFGLCLISFLSCAQSSTNSKETSALQTKIKITINGNTKTATLVENSSTLALIELLKKGNVTVNTDDYGNFEKVGNFGSSLPQNNTQIDTVSGDIILYQGKSICFYYGNNSWNFTRLGKLDISDEKEIREFLNAGKGKTEIVLSM